MPKQLLDRQRGVDLPQACREKLPFSEWRRNGDWFRQHLVVDGPVHHHLLAAAAADRLQRKRRYYEKGLPYLDRVVIRQIPDQASAFTQLLSGELDHVPQIAPSDVPRAKASPRLTVIKLLVQPLRRRRLEPRQAALPRPRGAAGPHPRHRPQDDRRHPLGAIRPRRRLPHPHLGVGARPKVHRGPMTRPRRAASSPPMGWQDTDGDGLLDKGGKPFAFELITNTGNQIRSDATVMMIQSQLKKGGIRATPRQLEFNTLVSLVNAGTFDATMFGLTIDTSLDITSPYHQPLDPGRQQHMRYRNAEVDRLIDPRGGAAGILDARPYLNQVQEIIHREQPLTFLWESQRLIAVNKRVKNVHPTATFAFFNLKEWWVEP